MLKLSNVHPSDTTQYPDGRGTLPIPSAGDNSKILMYNETPLNVDLDFLDGRTDTLHAWEANWWPIDSNTTEIDWQIDADSLSVSTPPINAIFLTLLYPNEPIRGTYPISLVRTVGGNVTTQQSQTLDNTGNAPNSNVVTIASTAANGNTVTLTNDGLFQLAVTIAGILKTVLQTFEPAAAGGTILQEGVATYLTEQLGNLKVDGTFESVGAFTADAAATLKSTLAVTGITSTTGTINANGGINTNTIRDDSNGNTAIDLSAGTGAITIEKLLTLVAGIVAAAATNMTINAPTGQNIQLQNNGTTICTIDGSNVALNGAFGFSIGTSGVYRMRNGNTIQNWSNFAGTGSGTYNHGFGTSPFMVIPIVDVVGSATQGYDTITSTQVHITLGAAIGFRAFCWA